MSRLSIRTTPLPLLARSLACAPVIAVLAWLLAGCSSPTEPEPGYELRVVGADSNEATFETADGQAVIRELHVLLDGQEMYFGAYRFDPPVASVRFSCDAVGARRGRHTLSLQLTSGATAPPAVCRSSGIRVLLLDFSSGLRTGRTVSSAVLPEQSASLRSGESLVLAFDI